MDLTPELIIATVGLIGGLVGARQAHFAAKKEMVGLLQAEVARDHERIAKIEAERNIYVDKSMELEADRNLLRDELVKLQRRATEMENRLAREEKRTVDAESQANEFRQSVVKLHDELVSERYDSQMRINKLVLIIENLLIRMKMAGIEPDIDLEDLKRMVIVGKGL